MLGNSCDVCLFTSVPDEFKALQRVFERLAQVNFTPDFTEDRRIVFVCTIQNLAGEPLAVKISCLPEMGSGNATLHISPILHQYSDLLAEARHVGFAIITGCACESLILQGSVVHRVRTKHGEIHARIVVDAAGAWAGRLGRESAPLSLKRLRRHLFVSGDSGLLPRDAPLVWDLDVEYYVRPEGAGLLLCPCDETERLPEIPEVDPEAEDLLVDKLLKHAPGLANVTLRRSWACLRTFSPDRLPIIG